MEIKEAGRVKCKYCHVTFARKILRGDCLEIRLIKHIILRHEEVVPSLAKQIELHYLDAEKES